MFLRRHHRTVAGKELTYYTLFESVRTEAGPRQRTVTHLGELSAAEESRWQRTVAFPNRQGVVQQLRLFPDDDHVPLPDDPAIVRIRLDTVGWTNPRRFGDIWLAWRLWRRLRLEEIVNRHVPQGKRTVLPATVAAIEVINRLCALAASLREEKRDGKDHRRDRVTAVPVVLLRAWSILAFVLRAERVPPGLHNRVERLVQLHGRTPLEFTCRGPAHQHRQVGAAQHLVGDAA